MQLVIKVIPQASSNRILGFYNNMLKIQLQGTPIKGKLNFALVDFLSEQIGIPKSAIILKQGFSNPVKRLEIHSDYNFKAEVFLSAFVQEKNQEYSEDD